MQVFLFNQFSKGVYFVEHHRATGINMADLTPVTGTGVTDAFCYRERRWRTDAPRGKGEARRVAAHQTAR